MSRVDAMLEAARARIDRLDARDAAKRVRDGALLVDIRPERQREYEGVIAEAVVIERNVLEWRLDPTSPWRIPDVADDDTEIIVVCSEGYSSSLAAAALRDLGLRRAADVIGGARAWLEDVTP